MAAMKLSNLRILKDRTVKKKVWTDFSRLAVASKILLTLEASEQEARAMLSQHRAVLDDVETTRPTPRT